MDFCGIPIIINNDIGDLITRMKCWRRRGAYRLPKKRIRVIGRTPVIYQMDTTMFGGCMMLIANPEAIAGLKDKAKP